MGCFLRGLKDEIHLPVRMLNPPNIQMAYGLARMQEEYIMLNRRGAKPFLGSHSFTTPNASIPNSNPKPHVTVKKISPAQMKERREKGLCYYCDSKWNFNHKCPNLKLFLIEGIEELKEQGVVADLEEEPGECKEELMVINGDPDPEISFHAITGSISLKTMRLRGRINN